jgi:type III restriction enzyme
MPSDYRAIREDWRRNLPPLEAARTVFNYVATYNDFERSFAEFLDKKAEDVLRFASLGTTEQGDSGTQFRVDYVKPSGARGFYHPDWVVVQNTPAGEVNWIVETKGRVWEGTTAKDEAIEHWCAHVSSATGAAWRYMRIDQRWFDSLKPVSLAQLTAAADSPGFVG